MSTATVDVDLYLDHVKVVVNEATMEVLKALAFRIAGRAQVNIRTNNQIDTGFMVNSIYPIWSNGSNFREALEAAAAQTTSSKTGRSVDHSEDMSEEPTKPTKDAAGVVVGANYAIYQESIQPFLYPAAEAAAQEFGGEASKIYKEELPNERSKK